MYGSQVGGAVTLRMRRDRQDAGLDDATVSTVLNPWARIAAIARRLVAICREGSGALSHHAWDRSQLYDARDCLISGLSPALAAR
jgi:hypothetical protein